MLTPFFVPWHLCCRFCLGPVAAVRHYSEELSASEFDAKWKVCAAAVLSRSRSLLSFTTVSLNLDVADGLALLIRQAYFEDESLDSGAIRRGLNDLFAHDLVPEPAILEQALRACRRVNDFST